jgi:hypothetical protein
VLCPFLRAYFLCDDDFGFLFADLMTFLMTFLALPRADPDFFGDWPAWKSFFRRRRCLAGASPGRIDTSARDSDAGTEELCELPTA